MNEVTASAVRFLNVEQQPSLEFERGLEDGHPCSSGDCAGVFKVDGACASLIQLAILT